MVAISRESGGMEVGEEGARQDKVPFGKVFLSSLEQIFGKIVFSYLEQIIFISWIDFFSRK